MLKTSSIEKAMDLFQRCFFIIFSSTIYFEGGDCGTVQTSASLKATIGSSVDLTCKYTLESGDSVFSGLIAWQAKKSGTLTYENIALFSPPGGGNNSFTTTESAVNLKDRAELLDVFFDLNTFGVVVRVREVECLDEKEYQCSVTFISTNTGPVTKTVVTSLTVQAPAKQPYDIPAPDRSNIEENTKFILSCKANVGKPPGKMKWWRYRDQVNAPFLVAESSEIPAVQPGVCVYNVTFSIQPLVTIDDDQSVWRCSVDNELLTSYEYDNPNQETARINVYYKVRVPRVTKNPDIPNSQYSVGSSVTLTCTANGNPSPSTNMNINKYIWTFKGNPGDNATELPSNNGILRLCNLEETDTGIYTCTAFNGFNGKLFNSSYELELQIDADDSDCKPITGEPINEDEIKVIQTDLQSSTAGTTALVTSGVVLLVIGVNAMALASMTYIKARKIKKEYETLKERERYQTLSDVSVGSVPVSYEVLDRQPSYEYTSNYANSDYRVYSDIGEPRT